MNYELMGWVMFLLVCVVSGCALVGALLGHFEGQEPLEGPECQGRLTDGNAVAGVDVHGVVVTEWAPLVGNAEKCSDEAVLVASRDVAYVYAVVDKAGNRTRLTPPMVVALGDRLHVCMQRDLANHG